MKNCSINECKAFLKLLEECFFFSLSQLKHSVTPEMQYCSKKVTLLWAHGCRTWHCCFYIVRNNFFTWSSSACSVSQLHVCGDYILLHTWLHSHCMSKIISGLLLICPSALLLIRAGLWRLKPVPGDGGCEGGVHLNRPPLYLKADAYVDKQCAHSHWHLRAVWSHQWGGGGGGGERLCMFCLCPTIHSVNHWPTVLPVFGY